MFVFCDIQTNLAKMSGAMRRLAILSVVTGGRNRAGGAQCGGGEDALLMLILPNANGGGVSVTHPCQGEAKKKIRDTAQRLPALEGWGALGEKRLDGLAMVLGKAGHNLPPRLAVEQLVELVIDRRVKIRLHIRIGNRRTVGDS